MYKITSVTPMKNDILLGCTNYEGDLTKVNFLRIFDENNNAFEIKNFLLDKTTPCFTDKISTLVMLKEYVPEKFLHRGNKIEFDYK